MLTNLQLTQSTLLVALIGTPALGLTAEIILHDTGPRVRVIPASESPSAIAKSLLDGLYQAILPLATAEDVICGKDHHMTRFRLNDKYAGLPFSITAKKMTRIKIRWDNPDKVLFPFPEKKKTITFPHAGGESRLYFRAHAPVSGNVYIMDDQDVVIKTCPYSFLPVKRFRQSINVNINETENERLNDVSVDKSNNATIDYRISSKTAVPDGASWSWSIGMAQSESSTDSKRVNSNFSYNW